MYYLFIIIYIIKIFDSIERVGPRTILEYVTCQITPNTNLGNIDHRKIKLLSLDSSHQDDFNEPNFIKIQSQVILKTGVCRITKFENTPEISKVLRIFI